ncbi:MAG: DUF1343 domain-containing protein [Opitutales bacterium]|nr:DUF1343 domain-containing protein [Opitutales bacterium]
MRGFKELKGKRVGLLTHPAGVNSRGQSTVEVLRRAPGVKLVALFGPEHGIYGDAKANVGITDQKDPRTGLPVYSLYGKTRRPTPQMLAGVDTMVIDLQDLGVRSYTYISAMRYVIEECFKTGREVIVLDRPNPLGGLKVDGPPMDKEFMSYVGAYQVPYVYGLTIGELALMAKATPGWLEVSEKERKRGRLVVIPMTGWRRDMLWTDTGLTWRATSPAIPDLSAAMGYPMTGLGCQLGGFVHGYGSSFPFRMLQYSGQKPEIIRAALIAEGIPGLDFDVLPFHQNGKAYRGVYVIVTDWNLLRPTELSLHLMRLSAKWARLQGKPNPFAAASADQALLFNKHMGSKEFWDALVKDGERLDIGYFVRKWEAQAKAFQQQSRRFWLYR